jgi:electron transfer flavoprotein beta subunit
MRIILPIKIVYDDQDIITTPGKSLDYSRASMSLSPYDLNAAEAAVQLAADISDSQVIAVSVGGSAIDDSKLKKGILARGIDELYMVADDACKDMDAHATAHELAKIVGQVGEYDLIVCGDGSADLFTQQVDVQLASALDLPYVGGVVKVQYTGNNLTLDRVLEGDVETVEVSLPAVISIIPDAALPRICGMKDILAAGKKPMNNLAAADVTPNSLEVALEKAPDQADRRQEIYDTADENGLESFIARVKALA